MHQDLKNCQCFVALLREPSPSVFVLFARYRKRWIVIIQHDVYLASMFWQPSSNVYDHVLIIK